MTTQYPVESILNFIFKNKEVKNYSVDNKSLNILFSDFEAVFEIMGDINGDHFLVLNDFNPAFLNDLVENNETIEFVYNFFNRNRFITCIDNVSTFRIEMSNKKVKACNINFSNTFFSSLSLTISDKKLFVIADGQIFHLYQKSDITELYNSFIKKILFSSKKQNNKFHDVTIKELSEYMEIEAIEPSELDESNFSLIQMFNVS